MTSPNNLVAWRKSSYSANDGNCVEVGMPSGLREIGVRDTKNRALGGLTVRPACWQAFTAAISRDDLS